MVVGMYVKGSKINVDTLNQDAEDNIEDEF